MLGHQNHFDGSESMKPNRSLFERLTFRLALIVLLFAVVGGVVSLVVLGFGLAEPRILWLAFGTCVISSLVAHVLGEYPSGDDKFMARLGGGMFVRTGLPFLVVIFPQLTSLEPINGSLVKLVILFYFVGLVADVSLHVLRMKTAN